MSRQALSEYDLDELGYPVMTMLELLRYRRYVNLKAAAHALGMGTKMLRLYERGGHSPRRKSREAFERVFGLSWERLKRPAPHLRPRKRS